LLLSSVTLVAQHGSAGVRSALDGTNLIPSERELMNTTALSKDERKKAKRASRKKASIEKPKKKRDYARGSKKRKVKKMVRGQSKR
jgi:hypothetical protein